MTQAEISTNIIDQLVAAQATADALAESVPDGERYGPSDAAVAWRAAAAEVGRWRDLYEARRPASIRGFGHGWSTFHCEEGCPACGRDV